MIKGQFFATGAMRPNSQEIMSRPGAPRLRVTMYSPLFPEYAVRLAEAVAGESEVLLILDKGSYAAEFGNDPLDALRAAGGQVRLYRLFLRKHGTIGAVTDFIMALWELWRFKPQLVHFQECPNPFHFIFLRLMPFRTKLIVTVHDPVPHSGRDREVDRPLIRKWIRGAADLLLAHGDHCCRELAVAIGPLRKPIQSIVHGEVLRPPPDLVSPPIPGRILFFGRMEAYKGLAVMLEAAELLVARGVPFSLHLAGRGPELTRLRSRFEALPGISICEGFISRRDAIRAFQEAALIALPYTDATQSGVVAAAYGNGRPVVASNVGGLTDVVRDGYNGLLVEAGQAEALANAIHRALSHPELLASLCDGATETARTLMDWDAIAGRTVSIYRDLVAAR